jgi:predicted alpha-1,2-mannosidase
MVHSLVRHADDGGSFDRWPIAHSYTGGMVGTPTDQVIAETWLKGLTDFDEPRAWDYSWAHATGPVSPVGREAIEGYSSRGYVAWEDSGGPAALTLEYAWSDAALARWAAATGRGAEATELAGRAGSYANTWDAERGFFVGRYADGSFTADLDPEAWADDYVEGGAWQYLWMVPYDVDGMIGLQHGGDTDAFLDRYAEFWDLTYTARDTAFPDPYYWHGNEPDIHYAYLGSLAGHPARSADAIRWIEANRYDDAPEGLDGNDDAGTLSAWYLWSAIGVFPVAGTDVYAIGSPWFERAEIDHPDGTTTVVRAPGTSDAARYPQSVLLGGDPVESGTFRHADWVGGTLIVEMGSDP